MSIDAGRPMHDLPTPFAVLSESALSHNVDLMARWCREHGVELQPHGKTSMAPALFRRQLDAGATGITAATPAQVRVMREHGVPAVQLANELVQPAEARWVGEQLAADPSFSFTCWVDSPEGVALLDEAVGPTGAVVDVLLEVGAFGGRTGCRTAEQRAAVRAAIDAAPHVRLVGVAGYEGAFRGDRTPESLTIVREYLGALRAAAEELGELDVPVVLSAGGSMFFDLVAEVLLPGWAAGTARVVLRSGCYLAHDSGMYLRNSPLDGPGAPERLRPALTVWGSVVSRPEHTMAFLDVGRRNISFDQGLPVALRHLVAGSGDPVALDGVAVTALNDQHTFLDVPADSELAVGDRVELGVSHPCTTFDKWRRIPVVDDQAAVVDVVETYF